MSKKNQTKAHIERETRVIAVYNQKGGCGKTAISMQLGGALALRGFAVLVVDMDPQATASEWSSMAREGQPFPATVISLAAHKAGMVTEIEKMLGIYDFVIIDCPPAIGSEVPWSALQIANLGIIPVMPVMDNIWATEEAAKIGLDAKNHNPDLILRYVVSRMKRGKVYESSLRSIKDDSRIKCLNTVVSDRNAYPESQVVGYTVHARGNAAATEEIEGLTSEVLQLFGIKS